jgi:hypothetical protein
MLTAQTSSAPPAVHSSVHKTIEESGEGAPSRSAAQFLVVDVTYTMCCIMIYP